MTGEPIDPALIEFRPLSDDCLTGAFSCGEREIDHWLKKSAAACHARYDCRVFTAHLPDVDHPIAFYALAFLAEEERLLPHSPRSRHYFPSLHLQWLAVHTDYQGRSLGTFLMMRVIEIYIDKVLTTGLQALTLVALNEKVEKFYADLGFARYAEGHLGLGRRMLLPRQTALDLFAAGDA